MTVVLEGFKIATEFVFDAGLASAEVGGLQSKVKSLSDTADSAIGSLTGLGLRFAMEFSGLAGGMTGFISQAISASDQFTQTQLKFANIISSNMSSLTGHIDTFNDRMMTSQTIINDIVKDARKFGIPAKELAGYTAQMSAVLVSHGLAGENFKNARDLSRNLLKSAPTLGVHPGNVMNQLQNALLGRASMQGQLMPRLMQETEAFKTPAGVQMTTKQFNALDMAKRMEILSKAMRKFSSDTDVLAANANTVSGMIRRITDLFSGLGSILKPIGDVILKPLIPIINFIINYLKTNGKIIANNLAEFIRPLIEEPRKFLINLMQLKELASDVGSAAGITSFILLISHMGLLLTWIGGTAIGGQAIAMLSLLGTKMPILASIGSFFSKIIMGISAGAKGLLGTGLLTVLTSLIAGFATLTILFQAWSRATAKLKIEKFAFWAEQAPLVSELMLKLKESFERFMAPINAIIEGWSELFVVMRGGNAASRVMLSIMTMIADVFEFLSIKFIRIFAGISSIVTGIIGLVANVLDVVGKLFDAFTSGNILSSLSNLDLGENLQDVADNWMKGYDDVMGKYVRRVDQEEEGGVSQRVTNIGTQNNSINMNLKSQMQPDRIAFTVKDQLQKMTENRRTSKSLVSAQGFATS